MLFAEHIPPLTAHPDGFPGFWLTATMTNVYPEEYGVRALLANYVRHVEAAHRTYRSGRDHALAYVNHDGSSLPIYSFLRASSDFEHCVGNVHRAIKCMQGIRGHPAMPIRIRGMFSPIFVRHHIADLIRDIRDAVQHTYEMIGRSEILPETSFMLAIDGSTVSAPTPQQPDQSVKTFDRLVIGDLSLRFQQLVSILEEMGGCAELLVSYAPEGVQGAAT